MTARARALLLLLGSTACVTRGTPATPPPVGSAPANEPGGIALPSRPELTATVRGPTTALAYDPDSMGPSGQLVKLTLTNRGTVPAALTPIVISLRATHDGVAFPCRTPGGVQEREPTALAPGQSFTFDRELACTTPLPGTWEIAVTVKTTAAGDGDLAGTFAFTLAESPRAPKPFPGRTGLFVALSGPSVTRPLPPEAWKRGDYAVTLAVINGSHAPITLSAARLAFVTYRQGTTLSCGGQTNPVAIARPIDPGAIELVKSAVSCAPSDEGVYEIVGKLETDGTPAFEVGRVRVTVTRDPLLFSPERTFDPGDPKRP